MQFSRSTAVVGTAFMEHGGTAVTLKRSRNEEVDHNIRFGLAQRAFFTRRRLEKGEDGKEKTCVGCVDYGLKKSHFSTYSTRCSLDVAMLLKVKYQNTKKYIRLLSGFTFLDFIAQAQTPEQDIILEIQIDPGPSPTTQDGISEEDHSTSLTDTNTSLSSSDNDHSSRIEHGTPIGRRTSSQVIPRPTREVSESEAAKEDAAVTDILRANSQMSDDKHDWLERRQMRILVMMKLRRIRSSSHLSFMEPNRTFHCLDVQLQLHCFGSLSVSLVAWFSATVGKLYSDKEL
ncbi:hypothetical protein PAMA_019755 [Pampus argenteus]